MAQQRGASDDRAAHSLLHWDTTVVFDLAAFMDESWDERQAIRLVIGGFVAPAEEWAGFEDAWSQILASEGIREFHATDCANRRGEFENWLNPIERRRVAERLTKLIVDWRLRGAWVVVDLKAFDTEVAETLRDEIPPQFRQFISPYLFALGSFLGVLLRFQTVANLAGGTDHRVALVAHSQREWGPRALDNFGVLQKLRPDWPFTGITFQSSRDMPGLQASDLLARGAKRQACKEPDDLGFHLLADASVAEGVPQVLRRTWDETRLRQIASAFVDGTIFTLLERMDLPETVRRQMGR